MTQTQTQVAKHIATQVTATPTPSYRHRPHLADRKAANLGTEFRLACKEAYIVSLKAQAARRFLEKEAIRLGVGVRL